MPKIKKIKRDMLGELGDGFAVLTDAETADSGITVEADEVLVLETPAPSGSSSGDTNNEELKTLRDRLHTVNQESAARRIELREAKDKLKTLEETNKTLKTSLAERETEGAQSQAKELFTKYVSDKKLEFVSPEAGADIQEAAFKDIDWTKKVTPEAIEAAVKPILEKKKYVLKAAQLPPTDGGKQSSAGTEDVVLSDDDLASIAREFNIPMKVEKKE